MKSTLEIDRRKSISIIKEKLETSSPIKVDNNDFESPEEEKIPIGTTEK